MTRFLTLAAVLACLSASPGAEAQINYTVTEVSGSTWQYDYTITNTFTPANVGEFTVFFTLGQYANLSVENSPGTWSSIVAEPDPNLPADGFFDSQALNNGLASGSTQSSFSVDFTWLGTGTPGAQTFNIVDTSDYSTLYAGSTTLASNSGSGGGPTTQAPEIDGRTGLNALALLFGALAVWRGRRMERAR
jgi:hypothetical protein